MNTHVHAPHFQVSQAPAAPNAALLIDFDNVTMGMRSDLSKDLRKLLQSDVIRGKVTVQRAYADWRRYPQYIVPLSENSIDLIFAPAYGSSKKNATDIRMAIDAIELVFTRPEIGTYILLTGDSDFSSCVLKLKEYGKYVIGVGIQESSSDILVQNCDEYYSYTSLAGLQKTTETDVKSMDPWELVERAVKKMADKGDVMRSDRLKQVMLEIDSTFDESGYGFSKFSRFVTEAASRDILSLKKMPNGQYEVTPTGGGGGGSRKKEKDRDEGRVRGRRTGGGRDGGSGRGDGRGESRSEPRASRSSAPAEEKAPVATRSDAEMGGFGLLVESLRQLKDEGRYPVRDSDVKRKMLEIDADFDEGTLGFKKFSEFLREANEREFVDLNRQDGGSYEVTLGSAADAAATADAEPARSKQPPSAPEEPEAAEPTDDVPAEPEAQAPAPEEPSREPIAEEIRPEDVLDDQAPGRRLGPRGGTTRRRTDDEPPPILEGQGRPMKGGAAAVPASRGDGAGDDAAPPATEDGGAEVDVSDFDLPTDPDRIVRYLTSYKGVGEKTAQQVVDGLGERVFEVLQSEPGRVKDLLPANRADQLVAGWQEDVRRRQSGEGGAGSGGRGRRGRRSGRGRGRSGRGGKRGDR